MSKIGYIRVSTTNQNINRQIDQLKAAGCEKVFIDKISGKTKDRPELAKMMEYLREGDIVVITELARLGRSLKDLLSIADDLHEKNVGITSLKESIDYSTPEGRAMFQMLGVMAEFQRNIIADNVKQGLDSARARGRVGGRPKKDEAKVKKAIRLYKSNEMSIADICIACSISKSTLYKYIKEETA